MKRLLLLALISIFVSASAQAYKESSQHNRGLFVSVIDDPLIFSSREEIIKLIDYAKRAQIKTLFVQVYRANKSWFKSSVADQAPYETALREVKEDAFALLIREAHKSGIEVHAWLNLLSLSKNSDAPIIEKYGPEILTRNLGKKTTLKDYMIDNQYFLEPGDPRVGNELSVVVAEVLNGYPELDGLQFDYIRYPDKEPFYGHTKVNVERFKKATGLDTFTDKNEAWQKWKRDQVTILLKRLVAKTRSIRPNIQVSTTGCVSYSRAYYEAFQDWPSWVNKDIVDFVTVMSYPATVKEFETYLEDARKRVTDFNKLNIAIGAYKLIDSPTVFNEQFDICEHKSERACVVLSYGSLLQNPQFNLNPQR